MSDLEERLLALISKVHLGSEEVPDVLGKSSRAESKTVGPVWENMVGENIDIILLGDHDTLNLSLMNDFDNTETPIFVKDITVEQPLVTSQNSPPLAPIGNLVSSPTTQSKKCTSSLTRSIAESYNQAREKTYEAAVRNEVAVDQPSTANNESAAHENSSEKVEPQISRGNLPSSSTPRNKRYTSSLIQSAAESYNQAQDKRYEAAIRNAEAIGSLSAALLEYSAVCRERNEVEKLKAEAEIIKANALLMQAKTEIVKLKLAASEEFFE